MFRRVEEGINPDLEIGRYLSERTDYHWVAPVVGFIEYRRRGAEPITLGILHRYVPNQGTAWQFTVDHLSQYFERVAALAFDRRGRRPRKASRGLPACRAIPGVN